MKTLGQVLGECIRSKRLAMGLSQVEFGERCGFYQTYLSRIESGSANPTLNALDVIASALGISIFELFEEAGKTATSNERPGATSRAVAAKRPGRPRRGAART